MESPPSVPSPPDISLIEGSLLLRFYDPTSGKITLNGVDVREYSVKQVQQFRIVLTSVSTTHLSCTTGTGSVLGNLGREYRIRRAWCNGTQILAAARRANCDFIGDFPDGLDTEVGPRGAQLSGGQKQAPPTSTFSNSSELPLLGR